MVRNVAPAKVQKSTLALKSDFENTHALITQTLASGSPVGNFDIENLRSKATECVFSCYLSRLDPFHQSELLTIADASFESIAHYLHQQSPNKYPPANDEEQQAVQVVLTRVEGKFCRCFGELGNPKTSHSTLVAHLVKRVAYEVGLVSFFNVTNGKIASEMDVLLREVRDELSRFGIDTEFLSTVLMERMMARFQNVLTSVDHVLAQTTRDRLQDGVLPGQKGKRYLRLDTPLACYLLSFTGWVDEFVAWNTPNAQISDLIGLIKPKLTQLKTLGRVLPQQTFWDDY
ncbi:hypothetical protein JCM33374_g3528 [Metschnikowia sp. JCM 33374]|nr:hypothetical protein JCM33374_g3528 [Metschnikowia sp. JCM 33374]